MLWQFILCVTYEVKPWGEQSYTEHTCGIMDLKLNRMPEAAVKVLDAPSGIISPAAKSER